MTLSIVAPFTSISFQSGLPLAKVGHALLFLCSLLCADDEENSSNTGILAAFKLGLTYLFPGLFLSQHERDNLNKVFSFLFVETGLKISLFKKASFICSSAAYTMVTDTFTYKALDRTPWFLY